MKISTFSTFKKEKFPWKLFAEIRYKTIQFLPYRQKVALFLCNCLYSFPKVLDGSAKALMIIFVAWMHFVNFQTKLKESHEIRLGTNMLRNYDKPVYYKTSQNGQKGKSKINKFLFV